MIAVIQQTSTGHKVFGCSSCFDPKTNVWSGVSGRIRVVEGNPYHDVMVRWDANGFPMGHEYGYLTQQRHTSQVTIPRNGNIFRDLLGTSQR